MCVYQSYVYLASLSDTLFQNNFYICQECAWKKGKGGERGCNKFRFRATGPLRADNRQTVRRGIERERCTPDWISAWEFLERNPPRGTSTRGSRRRNWFTCCLLRRPLFSPDVVVPWRWNGKECKDAAAHASRERQRERETIIGQISLYFALVFRRSPEIPWTAQRE